MKRSTTTASPLYPTIRFAFTDHPITVWAGAILPRLYFELIGLRVGLRTTLAPLAKRSNNQIPAPDVLWAWFSGLAVGAAQFAHFTRYRRDPLLPQLLGLPRYPPALLSGFHLCPAHDGVRNLDAPELGASAPLSAGPPSTETPPSSVATAPKKVLRWGTILRNVIGPRSIR